ncbi:MAG TPA: protein kinase [Bryobacteraceae bacterium]|jgi:tRNA A-37 threonylcarbamoyl transferase component Bud32/tetratricopeptide (TPR) repeat protein|nr:protein kinase [Bryobacteraceae bacterium]
MSAEEWEQVKNIFEAALSVPEAQREAYLEGVCGGNAPLKQTVAELLASDHGANDRDFLTNASLPCLRALHDGAVVAGRFRIVRFIARGGMGEVYEAYDERLHQRLALKTLRPEFVRDRKSRERFEREIRITREVAHPNLCRIYDQVEYRDPSSAEDTIPCLTMQLLEGETLNEYLRRSRPLSAADAMPIVEQVASALSVLHDNGIIHRDLKPSNIILIRGRAGEMRAVVTDFGLAKPSENDGAFFESRSLIQAGAPYFMAPEVLRGDRPTVASDIYSLGLIIDEMVTRSRAYSAPSLQSLYYQKLWDQPLRPSQRADHLPPGWERIILECIDQQPENRCARAVEIAERLQRGLGGPVRQPGYSLWQPRWRARLRRHLPARKLIAGLAAALLLTLMASMTALLVHAPAPSVVVFPFANESHDKNYDYLCRGATSELVARLAQGGAARVIRAYEPRTKSPGKANGRFALEGMLRQTLNHPQLSVTLTDLSDGKVLWNGDFPAMDNPLQMEMDITRGAMQAVRTRLALDDLFRNRNSERVQLLSAPLRGLFAFQSKPGTPTEDIVAYDLYFKGRYLWDERTAPSALESIRFFRAATERDHNFAAAYAALADAQFVLMDYNQAPFIDLVERARHYADKAVALDPRAPEAYATLAAVQQMNWDWAGSKSSYETALRLNPSFARARRWYAGLVLQFGRFDEAILESSRALEDDPYDYPSEAVHGVYLFLAGRYQEAVFHLRGALQHKNLMAAHISLGDSYAILGRDASAAEAGAYFAKALSEAAAVADMESRAAAAAGNAHLRSISDRMYAAYYALSGSNSDAQQYVEHLERNYQEGVESAETLAWVYTCLGKHEKAIDYLWRAATLKDRKLFYVRVNPFYQPLRSSPEFQRLIAHMGLEQL